MKEFFFFILTVCRFILCRLTLCHLTLGHFTFGRLTLGCLTLGRLTLCRLTLGRLTLGRLTQGRLALGRLTLGRFTLCRSTLCRCTNFKSKEKSYFLSTIQVYVYTCWNKNLFSDFLTLQDEDSLYSQNLQICTNQNIIFLISSKIINFSHKLWFSNPLYIFATQCRRP